MNRNCIVRAHGAGLTSNLNKVITCLRFYETTFVDWSKAGENDPAFKYGGSFYGDAWHSLFYDPTIRPSEPFDYVYEFPTYEITGGCAGILYLNEQWNWRPKYHAAWKRLSCVVEGIPVGSGTVGVLIRSQAIAGEQLSDRNATLEEYAAAIDKEKGEDGIFVVSSDLESIRWLELRYPGKVWFSSGIKRNEHRSDPEQHITRPQNEKDAIDVMREVLALSRCRSLVHQISNMATLALIINPNLRSIYLR